MSLLCNQVRNARYDFRDSEYLQPPHRGWSSLSVGSLGDMFTTSSDMLGTGGAICFSVMQHGRIFNVGVDETMSDLNISGSANLRSV
jgi:hypothetical protein